MSKSIEKKQTHNREIVNALAGKYDFSPRYIRMILNDERTPIFRDRIKKEYEELSGVITDFLKDDTL